MEILHLVQNYHPSVGGIQNLARNLSEGFVSLFGDQVTVLTTNALLGPNFLKTQVVPPGDEVVNGVKVRRFSYWRRQLPVLKQVMRAARRIRAPLRDYAESICMGPISPGMLRETARTRADVIACMSFPFLQMYYPWLPWWRRNRRPVVCFGALHIHDGHIPRSIVRAIGRAQAYVAFTEFERDTLIGKGISADRTHVVGLGVDVGRFAAADGRSIRERLGVGGSPVVGFIGRQAFYKGCDTLLHAMTTVWERFPDAYLLLAGSRTLFSETLEQLVGQLPGAKKERVILVHDFAEEEKPEWFAACDILVSVSREESFGIVYLEAWASGKPVIGGRIGAVECVIREGEDGLLVPCGDAESLSAAIGSLLEDDRLRERLGQNGKAKVVANHDWPVVVERVRKIYEQVL